MAASLSFLTPANTLILSVRGAEAEQRVSEEISRRYNIGRNGNPVFGEVFRRPATACGASLKAADLLHDGGIVYSPAGGTHHGRPDRASGFCFFNDPALAILAMLDQGLRRVLYIDVDAHHADGVEAAFAGEPRVLVVSVHQEDLWPRTGRVEDRAGGSARNLPVPKGLNDSEMAYLLDHAIVPLARHFGPEAVVLQCGADALANDPINVARDVARETIGMFAPPISIYDNFVSETSARDLYEYSWLTETVLRLMPREMVYITPVRDGAFGPGDFDIGDVITVNIGNKARLTSSGVQRIYSYTIDIDDDAVEALGEFECSPDQDSI